jgi:hypothetical protein
VSILPNLPALEGSQQPLSIEAPQPPTTDTGALEPSPELDLVLRDRMSEVQKELVRLPRSPPSFEVTLHDVPVEAQSKEIALSDAPPEASQFFPAMRRKRRIRI